MVAQAWDLSKPCINNLYVAWNKSVRRILKLPYCTHRHLLAPLLQCSNINIQLVYRFIKLYYNMINSTNSYIHNMAIRCRISSTSCLGANVLYIYNVFNISVIYSSKCNVMNHINNVVNNLVMSNLPIGHFHVTRVTFLTTFQNFILVYLLQLYVLRFQLLCAGTYYHKVINDSNNN